MPANDLRSDKIWMDGTMVPYDEATVHVLTHSLHYGLAVFEGMRCYKTDDGHSAIFRAKEHIRRLIESGHIVEMEVPYSQEELLKACADVVRVNKFAECYLRPLVFFGEGEMGLSARGNKIRVSIAAWPWGAYLGQDSVHKGVRLKTSSFVRFHHNSMMPAAKATGHYVNSILAGYEARRNGYDEALLLDVHGYVAEGSGENFFIVRDGVVKTPPLVSALPGITRDAVMKILRDASIEVIEQIFPRDAVYIADESFMTGTAAEVTPVRELDDRMIGAGVPGPVTIKVQEVFRNALHGRDARYRDWLHYV
jgi:branched-chain amino acid aminotransferase